ncbi:Mitochondrial dicarboxylate carrier [Colletotrichum orbiculare MAFF 240422]|uniref:Mitochondrial dicarboxylate carrier n=1 Tax=Colletotrichum orbiculare (strain 104-T / ATCC 96160 / CBS 514.97 / LARS 414 / MAFF 240422) TaxID=1213857 RepID=A0A484FZ90_COLOR|nr:Mitochondrial dicarboxylate carrier [Colletotrichum orbiculare MAFF 240422]
MASPAATRSADEASSLKPAQPEIAQKKQTEKKKPDTSMRYPFWFGGSASSMAACVTHPLDLVKVRLQVRRPDAPKNMIGTISHIIRTDGPTGLYNGLSASLLRQMTYSTVRFGVYEEIKVRLTRDNNGKPPSFPVLVTLASASGFIGGISGNAADVLNVRMQQDAALPAAERRNYKHALEGMLRMAREEGIMSWFRGVLPNSMRAAAMTASQLASYDTFKGMLIRHTPMGDNLTTHFTASFLAGVMAATVTSPIDVIKTRVMSASTQEGLAHTLAKIYKAEGLGWMFKGWVPSFLRLGPQTICTFVFLEIHRKAYRAVTDTGNQDKAI